MLIPPNSTIAILGGSGKAGRPLVQVALQTGYRVRLLLRDPERFAQVDNRLEIIQGDARDEAALRQLLQGCHALLSTLGHPKGELTPIISPVTRQIISQMQALGISRYVVVTSFYGTGNEQTDEMTRKAADFMQTHFPQFMADRQHELDLLMESTLNWTCVRLPQLVQKPATGHINVNPDYLPGSQITTSDLAHFLVSLLTSEQYIRQAPFIAN